MSRYEIKCITGKPERKIIECVDANIIQIPMTEEEHKRFAWLYGYPCNWWLILPHFGLKEGKKENCKK